MFSAPVPLPCTSVISFPPLAPGCPQTVPSAAGAKRRWPTQRLPHQRAASLIFQLLGQRNPRSSAASTPIRAYANTPVIIDTAAMVLPDALTIRARALTSVTSTVKKKRYDSTAAAAADTGIRPATPQRMRHPPRRPPGARHHHCDCDLPRRIRPAGLDFQLTMAARTRRLIVFCYGGGRHQR